jgi:hypothetical protein
MQSVLEANRAHTGGHDRPGHEARLSATKSLQLEGTSPTRQPIGPSRGILERSFVHEWTKNAPILSGPGNAQIKELAYDRDYTAGAGRLS